MKHPFDEALDLHRGNLAQWYPDERLVDPLKTWPSWRNQYKDSTKKKHEPPTVRIYKITTCTEIWKHTLVFWTLRKVLGISSNYSPSQKTPNQSKRGTVDHSLIFFLPSLRVIVIDTLRRSAWWQSPGKSIACIRNPSGQIWKSRLQQNDELRCGILTITGFF